MIRLGMVDVTTTGGIQDNLQRERRLAELSAAVHMSPYHFATPLYNDGRATGCRPRQSGFGPTTSQR